MSNLKSYAEDYPANLLDKIAEHLAAVYETREEGITPAWDYPLPPDLLPSVEYAVATLSEREARVIHMRFQHGMSYDEIGKEFCVTRERIRQIEAKAIRKLVHPSRLDWIKNGVQGEIAERINVVREIEVNDRLEAVIADIAKIAENLTEITGNEAFKNAAGEDIINGCNLDMPIEELELSARSYHCLSRHGVKTLRDLTGLTRGELLQVRNLGKKSGMEIVEKVHQMGLRFKGEASEMGR